MKRIEMIVKGVSETIKAQYKEKRIKKALETAKLNAQEVLDEAKANLDEMPEKVSELSPEEIVSKTVEALTAVDDAEYTLEILDKVEAYFNGEVAE